MPRLTKRVVDAALPSDRVTYVWDEEIRGLCLRVLPSGIKSFCLLYRNEHGRQKWLTFGRFGEITAEEARQLALELRASVRQGEDPVAARKARMAAPTLNELLDRYEVEHLAIRNRASTAGEFARILRNHVRPALGLRKATDINEVDVTDIMLKMRETPRSANIVRAVLSKVFNLAEVWKIRPAGSNPCRHVQRYDEVKRERTLSSDELARLGEALQDAEGVEPEHCVNALRVLALTGCRLSEIITLRRDQVDLENRALRLTVTKTKPRLHILGNVAVSYFRYCLSRSEGDWLFPRPDGKGPLDKSRLEKSWRRIRSAARLDDVRIHDLRHNVGTVAGAYAPNAFLIRDKLGHSSTAMTNRYVHADATPMLELSNQVEKQISQSMKLGKVVKFKKKALK